MALVIEARVAADRLRRVYDITSKFYGITAALFDRKARRLGLQRAGILPGNRFLEVGTGPGISLREVAGRADSTSLVVGADISSRMLEIAHRGLRSMNKNGAHLVLADGMRLPFASASFDVLFSAYLLDLMPLADIRAALAEFCRVLRPDGRLVLVSMTKNDEASRSWWEWLYAQLPSWAVAWILGGCRPVLLAHPVTEAGFLDVRRELVEQLVPSEIVVARKPSRRE